MSTTVKPPDPESVWKRWEPRFIAAGVDWNIIQRLRAVITTWDQWCAAWCVEADRIDEAATEAFDRGRTLTAAGLWELAARLYHFGGMYFISDTDQMQAAERRGVEAFERAAPHVRPPAIPVHVEYHGVPVRGYLRIPDVAAPPPVAMFFSGFEGTKEENQRRTPEFLERGIATLSWDGLGRGETLEHFPMNGDQSELVALWIDLLEGRDDVDASRIGATGPNRGGHAAAKAAAHEPRIRALAVVSPGYDRRDIDWSTDYELAFFLHLFHLDSEEDLKERLRATDLTFDGDAQRISCPSLIVAGDQDAGRQFEGSRRLFEELSGPKAWEVVKGAQRNGNNVPYLIRPLLADFFAETFAA